MIYTEKCLYCKRIVDRFFVYLCWYSILLLFLLFLFLLPITLCACYYFVCLFIFMFPQVKRQNKNIHFLCFRCVFFFFFSSLLSIFFLVIDKAVVKSRTHIFQEFPMKWLQTTKKMFKGKRSKVETSKQKYTK